MLVSPPFALLAPIDLEGRWPKVGVSLSVDRSLWLADRLIARSVVFTPSLYQVRRADRHLRDPSTVSHDPT